VLARQGRVLARELSWHQQRIQWVKAALKSDPMAIDGADPPGAFFVLNGLSVEDMVVVYNGLTAEERQKLESSLDKTQLDRARIYQAIQRAKANSTWWGELAGKVHWAIRSGDFTSYPGGAYWLINPLNDVDRTTIMRYLDRDHLDELISHEDQAAEAGVPYAHDIAKRARAAREVRGPTASEKTIAGLIPGTSKVTIGPGQSYDLPPIKADVTDAFKALAALNDTQLLRALRALPAEKRFVLNMNVDQVDGLGIDGNRIRHFLQRAESADADQLRASRITDAVYHPDYKRPKTKWSRLLRINPPGNLTTEFDLSIDEVGDEEVPDAEVNDQWKHATIGRGGLLWPAKLNKSTVPNLWSMKQGVLKKLIEIDAIDELLVIQMFLAVEFVLHAGVGIVAGAAPITQRPRSTGGPFGTGGRVPLSKTVPPTPEAMQRARQFAAQLAADGEPVVVNLGGAGASHEPKNAINVNNMAVGRKNIPNLVEADGGAVGELFEAGTVDRVEGYHMAPGAVDWKRAAPGAFRVLKSGGTVRYDYRGANADAKVAEAELKAAGFQDVKALGDAFVTARKP
jgi:hypothetical protein